MNNKSLIQILSIPLFLIKLKILTQNLFFMEKVLYITCDLLDYNSKIIFLPLMKKPFEMAYINFLYSGFTLLPLKVKFNLTMARAFLIF
jgi:hypothetical protein